MGPPEIIDPEADNPVVLDSVNLPGTARSADFEVTPNGYDAVFTSVLSLSGYPNAGHREVYRYDSPSETLECVSCSPTGERASGEATLAAQGLSLSDDGRVFFNSTEGLVDRDQNEEEDVYEWEPPGAGPREARCDTASGCLDLVSPGSSPSASNLLTASDDGTDVFFFTRSAIALGDENGSHVRIYDAREQGGFPYIPPIPLCKASDECHGPGSPQAQPPEIQSVGSSPGGNEHPSGRRRCRAGFIARHGHCIRRRKAKRSHVGERHRKR